MKQKVVWFMVILFPRDIYFRDLDQSPRKALVLHRELHCAREAYNNSPAPKTYIFYTS